MDARTGPPSRRTADTPGAEATAVPAVPALHASPLAPASLVRPLETPTRWIPTSKWAAGRPRTFTTMFGAGPVECTVTGQLGFAKPVGVWQEWLASRLAEALGVRVPEVRLGYQTDPTKLSAVSLVFGKASLDLDSLRSMLGDEYGADPQIAKAIAATSGLLPFHAWIGASDHRDEHVLAAQAMDGTYELAGIDYGFSFMWTNPADPILPPFGSDSLVMAPDTQVIKEVVDRIEAFDDSDIGRLVALPPSGVFPLPDQVRVANGLKSRKLRVRESMRIKGWAP